MPFDTAAAEALVAEAFENISRGFQELAERAAEETTSLADLENKRLTAEAQSLADWRAQLEEDRHALRRERENLAEELRGSGPPEAVEPSVEVDGYSYSVLPKMSLDDVPTIDSVGHELVVPRGWEAVYTDTVEDFDGVMEQLVTRGWGADFLCARERLEGGFCSYGARLSCATGKRLAGATSMFRAKDESGRRFLFNSDPFLVCRLLIRTPVWKSLEPEVPLVEPASVSVQTDSTDFLDLLRPAHPSSPSSPHLCCEHCGVQRASGATVAALAAGAAPADRVPPAAGDLWEGYFSRRLPEASGARFNFGAAFDPSLHPEVSAGLPEETRCGSMEPSSSAPPALLEHEHDGANDAVDDEEDGQEPVLEELAPGARTALHVSSGGSNKGGVEGGDSLVFAAAVAAAVKVAVAYSRESSSSSPRGSEFQDVGFDTEEPCMLGISMTTLGDLPDGLCAAGSISMSPRDYSDPGAIAQELNSIALITGCRPPSGADLSGLESFGGIGIQEAGFKQSRRDFEKICSLDDSPCLTEQQCSAQPPVIVGGDSDVNLPTNGALAGSGFYIPEPLDSREPEPLAQPEKPMQARHKLEHMPLQSPESALVRHASHQHISRTVPRERAGDKFFADLFPGDKRKKRAMESITLKDMESAVGFSEDVANNSDKAHVGGGFTKYFTDGLQGRSLTASTEEERSEGDEDMLLDSPGWRVALEHGSEVDRPDDSHGGLNQDVVERITELAVSNFLETHHQGNALVTPPPAACWPRTFMAGSATRGMVSGLPTLCLPQPSQLPSSQLPSALGSVRTLALPREDTPAQPPQSLHLGLCSLEQHDLPERSRRRSSDRGDKKGKGNEVAHEAPEAGESHGGATLPTTPAMASMQHHGLPQTLPHAAPPGRSDPAHHDESLSNAYGPLLLSSWV